MEDDELGLRDVEPQFPVLMPDGGLCLLLYNTYAGFDDKCFPPPPPTAPRPRKREMPPSVSCPRSKR